MCKVGKICKSATLFIDIFICQSIFPRIDGNLLEWRTIQKFKGAINAGFPVCG